jgi:RNA polymerase sigma-70 factor (ECF subfamily)
MANPEEEARIRKLIADSVEGGKRGSAAFAQVVITYQSRVRAFCIRMVRNAADADDLTQQTFLKVWQNLATFRGDTSFIAWTIRIARNLCIDLLRKSNRFIPTDTTEPGNAFEHVTDAQSDYLSATAGMSALKVLENKETAEKVYDALDQMKVQAREILLLYHHQGLSYQEIATVLDIPQGTVMSRLFHARKAMQFELRSIYEKKNRTSGE